MVMALCSRNAHVFKQWCDQASKHLSFGALCRGRHSPGSAASAEVPFPLARHLAPASPISIVSFSLSLSKEASVIRATLASNALESFAI